MQHGWEAVPDQVSRDSVAKRWPGPPGDILLCPQSRGVSGPSRGALQL